MVGYKGKGLTVGYKGKGLTVGGKGPMVGYKGCGKGPMVGYKDDDDDEEEEEEAKEERRKTEAREAAKKRALATISNTVRNFRGTPYWVFDKETGEWIRVTAARQILFEVVRRVEREDGGEDLTKYCQIIANGPQLTILTTVKLLAAFRVGGVICFDKDQKPQEAADQLGPVRFQVFKDDPMAEDGRGEEVETEGHRARNMRLMGDHFYRQTLESKGEPTEGEGFNPPYNIARLDVWGSSEYCPDQKKYSKRGTRRTCKAGTKKPAKRRRTSGEAPAIPTKKVKAPTNRSKDYPGRLKTVHGAGALLWHPGTGARDPDFTPWKTPGQAAMRVIGSFPDMTLETAARVIAPFEQDFLLYNPEDRRRVSGAAGHVSGSSKAAPSEEDAKILTSALQTLGLPLTVAGVLARAPSSSWREVAKALGFDSNPDLVSALSVLRA
jgi:hypothetical protein